MTLPPDHVLEFECNGFEKGQVIEIERTMDRLFRPKKIHATDSLGGKSTTVKAFIVGDKPQRGLTPCTSDAFAASLGGGISYDTAQPGETIRFVVEFAEACRWSARVHGWGAPVPVWVRANFLPAPHFYNLNQACTIINKAFPDGFCYLVGSSLERRDYRDVDVRLIIGDAAYDRLFPSGKDGSWTDARWSLIVTSISLWLSQQTNLPIDFQIQRQTQANESHDGKRAALGIFLDYPGERPSDVHKDTDEGSHEQ